MAEKFINYILDAKIGAQLSNFNQYPTPNAASKAFINPDDLKIDIYRSSSAGGQNVQKNSTAIRITHIPTGLVVASQSQRSQHQNRATAMRMLISKIFALRQDQQRAEMERFYGEKGSISWGNQIRSYVFQPYRMVKDLRTGVETRPLAPPRKQ